MSDRSLKLEVILAAVDKATAPIKALTGASSKLASQVRAAKSQLDSLSDTERKVANYQGALKSARESAEAYRKAKAAVGEYRVQLEAHKATQQDLAAKTRAARAVVQQMVKSMQQSGAVSAEASARYTMAKHELEKLERAYAKSQSVMRGHKTDLANAIKTSSAAERENRRLASSLRDQAAKMREAGLPTKNLAQFQEQLSGNLDRANQALSEQKRKLEAVGTQMKRLQTAREAYDKTMETRNKLVGAGAGMAATGAAIGAPIANAVREYSSFEDAMLGVQRQVQGVGEIGSASYRQIVAEVKALARELPVPTNQIADMYTAAARMEVPREALADFTRTVTQMATAFDAVPDEIAEAMGKVAKNFKIPVTEIRGLADTINYLDDNAISKAGDIIDVLNRTSGVAASVKISEKAVAALASTLLTLGDTRETAGTAINAIIQRFAAAESGTKDFRAAMKSVGLSLKGVQTGMQTDAQGALFQVIDAIKDLPADQRIGIMVDLVGMEHSDTMAKLVSNTEEWRRQIELANDAAASGSMEREFQKRTQAMSAHWQRFKNLLFDINTSTGGALRERLLGIMDAAGGVLTRIADWMQANPSLTATIVTATAAVAAIVTGMGALTLAMAAVLGPFAMARYGLAAFSVFASKAIPFITMLGKVALPMVGHALLWIGRALMANPIGLAVTGIALAAGLVYQHWEPIKAWFASIWDNVKQTTSQALEFFRGLPAQFAQFGADMMRGLADGIRNAGAAVKDAVTGAAASATGWFKEKLGIRSPSRVFAELGGFTMQGLAQGLQRNAGLPLDTLTRTARALTAAAGIGMAGMATAGGVSIDNRPPIGLGAAPVGAAPVTNYITINAAPGMDPQAIARAVAGEIERQQRAQAARGRTRLADLE